MAEVVKNPRATPVAEMLDDEGLQAERVEMMHQRVGDIHQAAVLRAPSIAQLAVFGSREWEAGVEASQFEEARARRNARLLDAMKKASSALRFQCWYRNPDQELARG